MKKEKLRLNKKLFFHQNPLERWHRITLISAHCFNGQCHEIAVRENNDKSVQVF